MKIVINISYGGFGLSREAFLELRKMGNKYALEETDYGESYKDGSIKDKFLGDSFLRDIPRDDKDLFELVEKMGDKVNGHSADLKVVEISDGSFYKIFEYDGAETLFYSKSEIMEA